MIHLIDLIATPPALVRFLPQAQLHEVIHSIEPGRPPPKHHLRVHKAQDMGSNA
jgi:hypothetical protein